MIAWLASLPPAILSAYAAGVAAAAAATVALLQFLIGLRQSGAAMKSAKAAMLSAENAGRHRVAAFRQEWINSVIETLTEIYSIMVMAAARDDSTVVTDARRLLALRTKLEILLNPDEPDTIALFRTLDKIQAAQSLRADPKTC